MNIVRLSRIAGAILAPAVITAHCSAATLVEHGQPRATIVVGLKASQEIRDVAEDLRTVIKRVSGATLPIVANASGLTGTRILVGREAAQEAAARMGLKIPDGISNALNEEGYLLSVDDDTIVLAGNETFPYQGTQYAVYDLLHSIGCRWFMPGEFGESLPHLSTIRVDPVRRTVHPEFRIRNIWYSGWMKSSDKDRKDYEIWKLRNRMCRSDLVGPSFLPIPGDDTAKFLVPKEKYLKSHPEYFALNADGTRNPDFLCMSNKGAFEAATDTILTTFTKQPSLYCYSFSPPDAPTLCYCPDCTKATHGGFGGEGWGEVSDAYFDFVARVADKVADQCPGKWVTSMAYYNRCRPSLSVTKKRPNLIMYMAAMQQCPVHSYADKECWSRSMFKAMIRRWSELSAGVVLYEYDPHDWSMLQRPTWRGQGIADDYRFLKEVGGWGFNDEGQIAWISTGLNYYLRARLAWNVNEDPQALEKDFCERFFGPAAAPMLRCYTTIETGMRASRIDRPRADLGDFVEIYTRPIIDRCLAALKEAGARATSEPYRGRVVAFRALIDRMDAYAKAHEAIGRSDFRSVKEFATQMVKVTESVGDTALLADYGPVRKGLWSGAGLVEYAERMQALTEGPRGRLIAAVEPTVPFHTDQAPDGILTGWFQPEFDDSRWPRIRTSRAAYTQGIVTPDGKRQYAGVAWYRAHVTVKEADTHGTARMLIPFFRTTDMTIWCNGVFANHIQGKRMGELVVDVTGLLRPGDNVLAFRMAGEGGLLMPPVLYAPNGVDTTPAH